MKANVQPGNYSADWWWSAVVWATAATAIHNVVQQFDTWPSCTKKDRRLKVQQDPLAYLGVLVDILQEWDRYTSKRYSIVTHQLPIQAVDMRIATDSNKLSIVFPNKKHANNTVDSLESSLIGWEEFVRVEYQ